ncbi:hypothetical protein [Paracoccus yeei]|uniref:hypothetical protein n=1 Tax=Paracoccus yeei TaxID=147645 RepID=UPI0012FD106C|nr:hypothetical protein [Paracoccus yeei]
MKVTKMTPSICGSTMGSRVRTMRSTRGRRRQVVEIAIVVIPSEMGAGRVAPAGLASDHSLWKSNQALPFGVYQE